MNDQKKQAAETNPVASETESFSHTRGLLSPVANRSEYEKQMNELPPGERELAEEATRHADLCRYFSEENMQLPPHLVRGALRLSTLSVLERAKKLQEINVELMVYLQSVSEDSELRM